MKKIKTILLQIFSFMKKTFKKLKEWALFFWQLFYRYHKIIFAAAVLLASVWAAGKGIGLIGTKVFYYQNQFQSGIVQDRRRLKPIPPETKLQAYVRMYFAGGQAYQARLPYGGHQRILGVYHDVNKGTLVIDWAAGFIQSWQDGSLDADTELFIKSLKKNFPIKSIRFLVEGRPAGLKLGGYSLDTGISLTEDPQAQVE